MSTSTCIEAGDPPSLFKNGSKKDIFAAWISKSRTHENAPEGKDESSPSPALLIILNENLRRVGCLARCKSALPSIAPHLISLRLFHVQRASDREGKVSVGRVTSVTLGQT